ncbi:hypothetical protein Q0M94_10275 [Deinococcus radiomollis]
MNSPHEDVTPLSTLLEHGVSLHGFVTLLVEGAVQTYSWHTG